MLFFETIEGELLNLSHMQQIYVTRDEGSDKWLLEGFTGLGVEHTLYRDSEVICENLMARLKQLLLAQGKLINYDMIKDVVEANEV